LHVKLGKCFYTGGKFSLASAEIHDDGRVVTVLSKKYRKNMEMAVIDPIALVAPHIDSIILRNF